MGAIKIQTKKRSFPDVAIERRAAMRYAVAVPVSYRGPGTTGIVTGITVNLSREGMFIACEHPPEVGTDVDIEVDAPEGGYTVTGVIARHGTVADEDGFGIRLRNVSSDALRSIQNLLIDAETW